MENQRPLILISNDDGVIAKGISELIKFLRPLGEIVVMAPDAPRSGNASALTVTEPIHYQLVRKDVGLTIYKCSGSPVDCVKLAFHTVLDRKPDLVVGGINHGDNSAVNVHYSGTMGVVIEGCLKGVPSIGYSLCCHDPNPDFDITLPTCRILQSTTIDRHLLSQVDYRIHRDTIIPESLFGITQLRIPGILFDAQHQRSAESLVDRLS